MNRAHVTMDNGQEFEVLVRELCVEHGPGSEPEVKIEGILTRSTINVPSVPSVPELTVTDVIYNYPATVVYWSDKTRTVVKCQPGDTYDPKTGFLLALCKKVCGNTGNYNDLLRECVPGYGGEKTQTEPNIKQMRKELADFCRYRHCDGCPLAEDGFVCGRGKFFTNSIGELGYMTDESIIKHYRAMKGAKS